MPTTDSLAQDFIPRMPHDLAIPDNTVKSLFYWAMDLDIAQGARMVLLTVIRHVQVGGWDRMHGRYPHSGP